MSKSSDQQRRDFLKFASAATLMGSLAAADAALGADDDKDEKDSVTTDDGTDLHFIAKGTGKPLIMIPGWSQTAAMYKHQIEALSANHRCIAIDMRGHGDSEKPAHGYRMQRLAADLRSFIYYEDLEDVTVMGHSMGCSVIWAYWDMFAGDRISKIILVDQAPTVVAQPGWSDEQKAEAGAIFDAPTLYGLAAGLSGPDGVKTTESFFAPDGLFFTKAFPDEQRKWALAENLKFPRKHAADLLVNHCTQDWRDVIPLINKPTLVVTGKASFFPLKSQEWIAKQIKGSKLEVFAAEEGGGHFMFLENPEKFNKVVMDFLS
ncbi:MAG: alpha/beta hydrolase [Burkholderiales bacterium]